MLSQSARSNLQVKLIDDARKLLEQVQSQDVNKSFDSSFSSFHSDPLVQKQEPPSPSKFNEIFFVQKSQSEQEELDDASMSVGNLSYSRSERDDEFCSELDMSALVVNSPYRVTHSDHQILMKTSSSPMPQLISASFGSDVGKKSNTKSGGSGTSENKAESEGDSSKEIRELVDHRLENTDDPSICSAISTDDFDDSYENRTEEKDGNRSMPHLESLRYESSQMGSCSSDKVYSVFSGGSDDFEGNDRSPTTSVDRLKSLQEKNMLSSARSLIASYRSLKSSDSKSADSRSSTLNKCEQNDEEIPKEQKIFALGNMCASEATLKTEDTCISQSDQNAADIKHIDSLLNGKSVETISVSSNVSVKPSATEVGESMEFSVSEVKSSEVAISIDSFESVDASSSLTSSQKSKSIVHLCDDNIENADIVSFEPSKASNISSTSKMEFTEDNVENIETNTALSRSRQSSSAVSAEVAKVDGFSSSSQKSLCSDIDANAEKTEAYSDRSRSQKSSSSKNIESTKAKSVSSGSQKSSSTDRIESARANIVSSPLNQPSSADSIISADYIKPTRAKSDSSRTQKLSSDESIESVRGTKVSSSTSQKSSSAESMESARANSVSVTSHQSPSESARGSSVSSRSQEPSSSGGIISARANSVSSRSQKLSSVGGIDSVKKKSVLPSSHQNFSSESNEYKRAKSTSSSSQQSCPSENIELATAKIILSSSHQLSPLESIEVATANGASSSLEQPSYSESVEQATAKSVSSRSHQFSSAKSIESISSKSQRLSHVGCIKSERIKSVTSRSQQSFSDDSGGIESVSNNNESAGSVEHIEIRGKSPSNQTSNDVEISASNRTSMAHMVNADSLRSVTSEKSSSNSITITRKTKKTANIVEMKRAEKNNEYDGTNDIVELQEENNRLQEENVWLQEDMNSFDEKLACLEITLGIIDSVEKKTAEFNLQEAEIERQVQEHDKSNPNNEKRNHDDYSTLSGDSRLSHKSRKSLFSKSRKSSKGSAAKRLLSWTRRSAESRRSVTSKTSKKSKSSKSEQSNKYISSDVSQQSHISNQTGTDLAAMSKNMIVIDVSESRDEQQEITRNHSTSTVTSMSRKEKSELKMLRENNGKMLYAIKALSKATTIQTRKHHHYKNKFGHTRKNLVEGNVKLGEVTSNFYNTRAQFLEEQDKREELSDSVQVLAKKMNDLRRKLRADEENKICLLDRIDENSIVSFISISNSTNASVSSRLSAINESDDATRDSLDEVLSPRSQTSVNVVPPKSEFRESAKEDNDQTKLDLELEVLKLKAKIERRELKIGRLQNKFSAVKGYLKGIEDGHVEGSKQSRCPLTVKKKVGGSE
eukprot:scaffold305_cov267-Chaetoceros_neogracile.AAC.5